MLAPAPETGHETQVAVSDGFDSKLDRRYDVEVFYDGDCPLCKREINFLRWLDRRNQILFSDIAEPDFSDAGLDRDHDQLMAELHGRLPNGRWITGMEVFRRLYAAVGLGWLFAPTKLPLIRPLFDRLYGIFARNRLKLTGRCDSECRT